MTPLLEIKRSQDHSHYVFSSSENSVNLIINLIDKAAFMILAYCVKVSCTPTSRGHQGSYPAYFLEMEATCFGTG